MDESDGKEANAHGNDSKSRLEEDTNQKAESTTPKDACDICINRNTVVPAVCHCSICEENLCSECLVKHKALRRTSHHQVVDISERCLQKNVNVLCETCSSVGKTQTAVKICFDCDQPEPFCSDCAEEHSFWKKTQNHVLSNDLHRYLERLKNRGLVDKIEPDVEHNPNDFETGTDSSYKKKQLETSVCSDQQGKYVPKMSVEPFKRDMKTESEKKGDNTQSELAEKQELVMQSKSQLPMEASKRNFNTEGIFKPSDTDIENYCEPCLQRTLHVKASICCLECDERYCNKCASGHKNQKLTANHTLVDISIKRVCDPCAFKDINQIAKYSCDDCEENLCDKCKSFHALQKQYINHRIKDIETTLLCETCKVSGEDREALSYCLDCKEPELFCSNCAEQHTAMKLTRNHKLSSNLGIYIARYKDKKPDHKMERKDANKTIGYSMDSKLGLEKEGTETAVSSKQMDLCDICKNRNIKIAAVCYCDSCEENLCSECLEKHAAHRKTRNHDVVDITKRIYKDVQVFCETCSSIGKKVDAVKVCFDCDEPEPFCRNCAEDHKARKKSSKHLLSDDLQTYLARKTKDSPKEAIIKPLEREKTQEKRPGQPYVTDTANMSNHILLTWDGATLTENDAYQILLKDTKDGKWRTYKNSTIQTTIKIEGLKAETSYLFKIRVVNDVTGEDGPYSQESEVIKTSESPALKILKQSVRIYDKPIEVYALPLTEIKSARNEVAKTRKLCLGEMGNEVNTKTIMIVGATGSGKSTLINAMANYLVGVSWEDRFRFTLVNVETCEKEREGDQARSQTEWVTCYTLHEKVSNRLKCTVNLIDTPGFGDTRGLDQDNKIIEQVRQLFSATGDQGVRTIDAVCFILKAPDARLTAVQIYIYESILSLFGKDIKDNICTLVTFADGERPPVLASLEALEHKTLPYEKYFPFNNSALYTDNSADSPGSLSPTFWEMGIQSCKSFFDHLMKLPSQSLLLTSEVLLQRERLENTVFNLHQEIELGLSKIDVLEQEVSIFTKCRREIRENKDFEYTVTEQVQEKFDLTGTSQYTTNCLSCNFTCHENCAIANDQEKAGCCAMGPNGNCTECPGNCHWTQHHNTPYIIKLVNKKKKKKYSEKQKIYESAKQKSLTQEQILEEMSNDIEKLEVAISDRVDLIAKYNNRLKEIALRPDPLSTVQYIDLMISSEKRDKKSGFEARIDALEKCKKRAQVGKSVDVFRDRVQTTRDTLKATAAEDIEDDDTSTGFFAPLKNLGKRFIHAVKL